ncbi:AAA family ATPase [Amycolatopsis roodepoortensis]|uniref:AAA family ATPase n=1 Tax=Amycolatopsis roodepoortensis TaxID=700274 RepID=UPI00214B203E|nr:AAA family ATPase [Amycolatopsis roodepoortensis]UUV29648.1 AAA family ATPase [Amycolatopsis roodepoortensis]
MTVAQVEQILLPSDGTGSVDVIVRGALDRCRDIVDTTEDSLNDAMAAGPWFLRSVELAGFRGAANGSGAPGATAEPFRLTFPASAGLVVVHAPNGTGKSTVTDALEVALFGGTGEASGFNPADARGVVAVHSGLVDSEAVVVLENNRGDTLHFEWNAEAGIESAVATWRSGTRHEVETTPGGKWASSVASRRPVVGYDHLTHRLRADNAADIVEATLALGEVWPQLRRFLDQDLARARAAYAAWWRARDEAVTALTEVDEALALRFPEFEVPQPVRIPESPAEDVEEWFRAEFGDRGELDVYLTIDPRLSADVATSLEATRAAVEKYIRVKQDSGQELWSGGGVEALEMLISQIDGTSTPDCPMCGSDGVHWSVRAHSVITELRSVREEFNLTRTELRHLGRLLVERVLPVLRRAKRITAIESSAVRLTERIESLVGHEPTAEGDFAWTILTGLTTDVEFAESIEDLLREVTIPGWESLWSSERRRGCRVLVDAHREYGSAAASVDACESALQRLAKEFDAVHADRREVLERDVQRLLQVLLPDVELKGLALATVPDPTPDRASPVGPRLLLNGYEVGLGVLSAGQYNAFVLALLLAAGKTDPFRFLVVDDPVHALDDLRIDAFATLVESYVTEGRQMVLLTHDDRLVDVLRLKVGQVTLVKLGRDRYGNLQCVDSTHPWQALVEDARSVLRQGTRSGSNQVLSDATLAVLTLSLCRQAIDAALREFVQEEKRPSGRAQSVLTKMDQVFTTRATLKVVRRIVGTGHPAAGVIDALLADADFLRDLNAGAHGDPHGLDVSVSNLETRSATAEKFCRDLLASVVP